MVWDPDHYLRFAGYRTRPALELMARIPPVSAARIVDLGSGTGHVTAKLAERWPGAAVTGVDSSPEMIERARSDHPQVHWVPADISRWDPGEQVDVVFSNAALHWLDDHPALFRRLRSWLAPGGVLAVQMPDNWAEPTHRIPAGILDDGTWPDTARDALLRDRLADARSYAAWVQPAAVDVWRTTYHQRMPGEDPVWAWGTGSFLRPVLTALNATDRRRFAMRCKAAYAEAYPPERDGTTVLPISRLFIVARG